MAKQSQNFSSIKNLSPLALLITGAMIIAIFAFSLGFIGSEYSIWLPVIIISLLAVIAVPMLRKIKKERYYEAIAAAHDDIKPPIKLKNMIRRMVLYIRSGCLLVCRSRSMNIIKKGLSSILTLRWNSGLSITSL